MRSFPLLFAFLLLPCLSYGQLEARIDSIDFSRDIIIEDRTGVVDFLVGEVPSVYIRATVINKSNKDILLIPTSANYNRMVWLDFKQGNKYYYIPAIWIDLRTDQFIRSRLCDLHIGPHEKISLAIWGYAPDMRENKGTVEEKHLGDNYLTDFKIDPVWVCRKEKKTDYATWFKEVLPTIRMVMMYGLETGKPSVLVSEPINPEKTIITGNMLNP